MITSLSASVIITTFPFYLLVLLEAKSSVSLIFSFFLRDFLKAFLALYFCGELVTKLSFEDIDLLDLESSFYTLGILFLNRNKLYSIFAFKPLTSSKGNSRGAEITGFSADSSLISIIKINTKSL